MDHQQNSLRRRRATSAAMLSIAALCLAACHRAADDTAAAWPATAPVVAASRQPIQTTLHVAGEFLPYQEVELHAKVAGYIRNISVDIGDRVKAGQVLATLDVPEIEAQVQGAVAGVGATQQMIGRAGSDVARAQANATALHAAAERLQKASAAQPGLIAAQELENAQAADRAAAAQVDAAKSALAAEQQQLGVSRADQSHYASLAAYRKIIAPFDGVITARYADTGALVQAGTSSEGAQPVVKIAQVNVLRMRVPVPEELVAYIHDGGTANIRVQATGEIFTGKIIRNTASLDMATRTEQVEVDIQNTDGHLKPGMYADVSLPVRSDQDALVVPTEAIDNSGPHPVVLVVKPDDTVERRTVMTGIATPNRVAVTSGLHDGEQVIATGLDNYHAGEKVTPKPAALQGSRND